MGKTTHTGNIQNLEHKCGFKLGQLMSKLFIQLKWITTGSDFNKILKLLNLIIAAEFF